MLDEVALAYGGFDSICVTAGVFWPSDTSGHIPDDKWAFTFGVNVTGSYIVGDEAFKTWKEQGLKRRARPHDLGQRRRREEGQRSPTTPPRPPPTTSCANSPSSWRRWCASTAPSLPATVVQGSAMFPRDRVIGSLAKYNIPYTDDEATDSLVKKLAQFYADRTLTKAPITPADQAEAYFLLVSQRLSKTTGQIVTVDGGLHEAVPAIGGVLSRRRRPAHRRILKGTPNFRDTVSEIQPRAIGECILLSWSHEVMILHHPLGVARAVRGSA